MSDPGLGISADSNGTLPQADQQAVSPGATLAACRRERGWTIEQVASQLNLAPRQIAALEGDDFSALPGTPIVRGFIRGYAKLLKIDAAPLLVQVGGETIFTGEMLAPRKSLAAPFSEARLPTIGERPALASKWVVGLLLLVLAVVVLWAVQQYSGMPGMSESASTQVKEGWAYLAGNEGKNQAVPAPERTVPDTIVAPTDVAPQTDADASSAPAANPADAPAPAAQTPVASTSATPQIQAPSGKNTLLLKVREESWVEIRRVDNDAVVVSRLMSAGDSESIEVTQPVSLVIGNASGVEVTLRGAPVELKASTASNVARLNVK